jgi:hypothetical protein
VLRQGVVFTRDRLGRGRLRALFGDRPITAEAWEGTRLVATIESRLQKSREVAGYERLRRTEARLPSGATWTITTEPDPDSMVKSRARRRWIMVRDEFDRPLANGRPASGEQRKALARDALGSFGDDAKAAAAAVAERLGSARARLASDDGRRSIALTVIGGVLIALSVGWLVAFTGLIWSDPGLAVGLGIAGVLAGLLARSTLRRRPDADRCRSCGAGMGGGSVCGECGAERTATWRRAASAVFAGAGRAGQAAGRWVERGYFEPIEISTGDQSSWLIPESAPSSRWSGAGLTVTAAGRDEVRMDPDDEVPLETALLVWHRVIGDFVAIEVSGGGG